MPGIGTIQRGVKCAYANIAEPNIYYQVAGIILASGIIIITAVVILRFNKEKKKKQLNL
jgi:hypothetical protein